MKNIVLIILSCIGLQNCSATSIISGKETLIKNNSKIMGRGYFTFLVFENENEVNEIIYHYSINIKNKKCSCLKTNEKRHNINDYLKRYDISRFKTAKGFSLAGKYYNCFADNFLDMTNDEKINLLNKLSEK